MPDTSMDSSAFRGSNLRATTTTTTATTTTTTATTTAQRPQRLLEEPFTIIGGAGYFEMDADPPAVPDGPEDPEYPHGVYWHLQRDPNPHWLREFWRNM